jgi:hypothetical protein
MGQYQFDEDQLFVPDAKQVGSIHQRAMQTGISGTGLSLAVLLLG